MDSHDAITYNIRIATGHRRLVEIEAFSYRENSITFLLGESGIGKTLISKAIYGLLDPLELDITVNGRPYRNHLGDERTKQIRENSFFVFQEPSSHLNPLARLRQQLKEGSLKEDQDDDAILRFLWDQADKQQIHDILNVYPKPFRPSGGEKQRILIAMAIKKIRWYIRQDRPSHNLFVFDEPSGSLDNHFRNLVLDMLMRMYRKYPFTILLITHDYSMISRMIGTYPDLAGHIGFKELVLKGDSCVLNDFSPTLYLDWIREQGTAGLPVSESDKPVLRLGSGYRVFGRSFSIRNQNARCDLVVHPGEIVYLKARSGVGKTTLSKIISGLQPAEAVDMHLAGHHITQATDRSFWARHLWGKKVGMVFQHADEALNLESSVRQIFQGLPVRGKITAGWIKKQLTTLFEQDIDREFLNKKVKFLSGGQKQRLNLLRTLSLPADLIILDEPLNGLDFESCQKIIGLLREKISAGQAFLLISHNEEIFDAIVPAEQVYQLLPDLPDQVIAEDTA